MKMAFLEIFRREGSIAPIARTHLHIQPPLSLSPRRRDNRVVVTIEEVIIFRIVRYSAGVPGRWVIVSSDC